MYSKINIRPALEIFAGLTVIMSLAVLFGAGMARLVM